MEKGAFVVEGLVDLGPEELPLFFLDGRGLAPPVLGRFPTGFDGEYHRLGRMRLTFEPLEEPDDPPQANPLSLFAPSESPTWTAVQSKRPRKLLGL